MLRMGLGLKTCVSFSMCQQMFVGVTVASWGYFCKPVGVTFACACSV